MNFQRSPRMRTPIAAKYLGLSKSTLAKMRVRGDGPVFIKVGPRVVLYEQSALDEWLAENRHQSTSEYENNSTPKS